MGLLTGVMHWFSGFVQDDTYISLRYARNLAEGRGLVFNPGERVEGFTNFSWTLLAAFFFKLHLSPLNFLRAIGAVSGLGLVILVWLEAGGYRAFQDNAACFSSGVAALILASSTTLGIWAVSGLEQVFLSFLLFSGFLCFFGGNSRLGALVWLAALLTRPEAALAFALGVLTRLFFLLKNKEKPARNDLQAIALFSIGFISVLCGRFAYYGEWVPNTFFIKGVANWESHLEGFKNLKQFLPFNYNALTLVLALVGMALSRVTRGELPWAGTGRKLSEEALFSGLFVTAYFYYMVRIGGEFLPFYRLYLPILPFLALWAGRGVHLMYSVIWEAPLQKAAPPDSFFRKTGKILTPFFFLLPTAIIGTSVQTSFSHWEYRRVADSLEACHGVLGEYLEKMAQTDGRTRPLTVLAQDMGCTPFHAPSARFVDVIGLTDAAIAHLLYKYNYTPYLRYLLMQDPEKSRGIAEMEEKAREYVIAQNADYVIFNVDCDARLMEQNETALAELDMDFLLPLAKANVFYYGLASTNYFRENYDLVAGFPYSTLHSLLLFRRNS